MWMPLMASVIWMSALTNCLIAGFSSGQLRHYLPNFYMRDDENGYNIEHEDGWLVVFVIFGLERLLLAIGVIMYFIIPSVPEDVADELERRQYIRQLERADTLAASMRAASQQDTIVREHNGKKRD